MKLQKEDKLLLIGDSLTDVGRAQPIGEGLGEALGRGYPNFVDAMLRGLYPQLNLRIVNMGTSGNTARDLKNRWQRDVLDMRPQWVSIMIGANDVWRQFDLPQMPEIHVMPEEYELTLDDLVARTLDIAKGVVLMTPYYIEPNPRDAMRARMDEYGAIVKKIASKHRQPLVDTQAALAPALAAYYPATLSWDRVHPSQPGHMILAKALLDALDFSWDGAT